MSLEVRDNPLNLRCLAASQVGRNGGHVADALRWNAQVLQQLQLQRCGKKPLTFLLALLLG